MGTDHYSTRRIIVLVVLSIIITALFVMALVGCGASQRDVESVQPHQKEAVVGDSNVTEIAPQATQANSAIAGTAELDASCAVTLTIVNHADSDAVVSIYLEINGTTDEHEDVVPARGKLSLALIREGVINYIFVREATGTGNPVIDWTPDYSACADGPAVTPPGGGVGDSQQIERPSPEAPWTTEVEPPASLI